MRVVHKRGMRVVRWEAALGCIVIAMLAPHAAASSLTLSFDGMYFGSSTLTARTTVANQVTVHAGAMRWSKLGDPSNQVLTMGMDLTQAVLDTSPFTIGSLHSASSSSPLLAASALTSGSAIGEFRAGLIQDLYNKYWQYGTASRTESAAFQLAVWELIYEQDIVESGTFTLNVTEGNFRVTGGTATQMQDAFGLSAVDLANTWLGSLYSVDVTNLHSLRHSTGQDQIIITMIPLPPALAMAGLGLLVGGIARRRMLGAG